MVRSPAALVATAAIAFILVLGVLPTTPDAVYARGSTGWLYAKRFVPDEQRDEFKGFVEPMLFVYDDSTGALLPSERPGGHYRPGEMVELPEGWYQVELTHTPELANRWRYYVKRDKATVVRSGMVILATVPVREQPRDVCQRWRAVMYISVTGADGAPKSIMSNQTDEVDDFGMLQLHEGRYVVGFNGLTAELEIRADRTLALPATEIGPLPHRQYRLSMKKDDSSDNPSVLLCAKRTTQVLAGSFWGSYWVATMEAPFRRRVWEEQIISPPGALRYKKAPRDAPSKPVFRGEGSRPTRALQVRRPAPPAPGGPATGGSAPSHTPPDRASETNPIPTP